VAAQFSCDGHVRAFGEGAQAIAPGRASTRVYRLGWVGSHDEAAVGFPGGGRSRRIAARCPASVGFPAAAAHEQDNAKQDGDDPADQT
jgi:hypothetical protein